MIIGIAGGTGSGKTTVAHALQRSLGEQNVALLSQDSYYVDLGDLPPEERKCFNFDHPNAFENPLLLAHLEQLRSGQAIEVPIYDYRANTRTTSTICIPPLPVVVVEGLLILSDPSLRAAFDIKVFVDTDSDVRILRRLMRDVQERGRTVQSVYDQYLSTVKPMHDAFVEPSKRFADVIIPEGGHNTVALSLLVSRIERYLEKI